MIRDKINKILDILPEELESVYWSIVPIQKSYEFKQHLRQKGVQISQLTYGTDKIIDLWDKTLQKILVKI